MILTCSACGGKLELVWNRLKCASCGREVYVASPIQQRRRKKEKTR